MNEDVEEVKMWLSDYEEPLEFSVKDGFVVAKLTKRLESKDFAKLAQTVEQHGGKYIEGTGKFQFPLKVQSKKEGGFAKDLDITEEKKVVMQINQLEDELSSVIELTIVDVNCNFNAYFYLKEWDNFKKLVNEFEYGKSNRSIEGKNTGIHSYVDPDGEEIVLHLDGDYVWLLITFSTEDEWENFKKQVNEFKYEEVVEEEQTR